MTAIGWVQIALYCAIIVALTPVFGGYMTRVFSGERTFLAPVLRPVELVLYRAGGVNEKSEQGWLAYTIAMLLFHVGGFIILYALMRLQAGLPFNPAEQSAVAPDLSFNTAVSFITNTNWQNYGGESTLSYLVQMLGLTHQNFLSAATGIVLAVALIRGFARASARTVGNFWVDITRCTLYVLLPICIPYALFLVWQGMPQTLGAYVDATTLEGARQTIAVGPVASQVAIKMLGTNGGGFFNANAAHPFENPTALSNFVQMLSIFVLGAALTNVFGRMVGNQRQGWAILAAMGVLFVVGVAVCYWAEAHGNDVLNAMGLSGSNMEGKEVRFGIVASALFAVVTTAASCGAVNAMHDSFTALGGMIPLINMELGEIVVGGVGAGLYGMLLFVIVTVFVAGLMVGRTPEYVGKKIEAREVKMAMLAILILPLMMLGWTAIAVVYPPAVASMANAGPHGFSEVLYAYTSQTANNGSAFAGLTGNTFFYNLSGAVAMFIGRFWMIVPAMAIAGALAAKKSVPPSLGTFPTTGGLFVGLLVGVILIVGGLTFFPALALGPIVETSRDAGRPGLLKKSSERTPRSSIQWIPPSFENGCRSRRCSTRRSCSPRSSNRSSSLTRARW
jgi:K+-transporting ATPase ATPase A chain